MPSPPFPSAHPPLSRYTATLVLSLSAMAATAAPDTTFAQGNVLATPIIAVDSADPVAVLVSRLDLERYKATIKGLTQFGDRRQGT